jgi:hypothetical protein
MFALLLCLTTSAGFSQTTSLAKPKIFASFPNTINCSVSEFSNAFAVPEGQHIMLSFSDNFKFSGTIISNVVKYSNLQSMTIHSDLSHNTVFHLSKQVNDDNSISYVGRIMDATASDGYQIKKDMAGNYKFEKVDSERILQECNQ